MSHGPACLRLNTGDGVLNRPSLGAWSLYGLGSDNRDLPGFITLTPSIYHGGTQNFGSAFLAASFQGTSIGDGNGEFPRTAAVSNVVPGRSRSIQRRQLDLLATANREHLAQTGADARLEARIRAFETAFRMQSSIPAVFDLSSESKETLALYGIGGGATDEYGRECLLARRFSERGVRFVQLFINAQIWDNHNNIGTTLRGACARTDTPNAEWPSEARARISEANAHE